MPEADKTVFIFLVVTWGSLSPTWSRDEERDTFGPFIAQEDGSHVPMLQEIARDWRQRNPDRPNAAFHLFATEPT